MHASECSYMAQYRYYCSESVSEKNMKHEYHSPIKKKKQKREKRASSEDQTRSENMAVNED